MLGTKNLKAKQLVFSVAATTMKKALLSFLRYEMKRGFIAWSISNRQSRRREKVGIFIRYLTIRNIILGIHQMLQKVISSYY